MYTSKKILYIALRLYANEITSKMKELGYDVDYYNEKPNDGFWCKTFVRFRVKPYFPLLDKYYKNLFDNVRDHKYEFIIFLRGEFLTINSIRYCRKVFPNTKLILYMWDSLTNYPQVSQLWQYFDKVFTFDRHDYIKYKEKGIEFLPLFYLDKYHFNNISEPSYKYDYSFIGTAHGDRPKIIKKLLCNCQNDNCFAYFYLPSHAVFYYNKLFIKDYKEVNRNDIHYQVLDTDACIKIYTDTKCIIDIESATQTGLTMRTVETLGMQKKLITTNKDIMNYDFYNSNNIYIMDRENPQVDSNFLSKPFESTSSEILNRYSLKSWVEKLLI